jgi:hypothetical protein
MSAAEARGPVSHDPLVVNTQNGFCWMRRAVTREGRGLYALADTVVGAPDAVLATLADLAEHGLASMVDALPMPVGPAPRTLGQVEDELTGVSLSLYEEQLDTARLRLALASAQRGRRKLRARVAELLTERHVTNEALDDAVRELRARRTDEPAETVTVRPAQDVTPQVAKLRDLLAGQRAAVEDQVVAYRDRRRPQTLLCREHGPLYIGMTPVTAEELLDGGICTYGGLAAGACGRDVLAEEPTPDGITRRFAAVQTLREDVEDRHDGPLAHTYRVPRDLPAPDGAQ